MEMAVTSAEFWGQWWMDLRATAVDRRGEDEWAEWRVLVAWLMGRTGRLDKHWGLGANGRTAGWRTEVTELEWTAEEWWWYCEGLEERRERGGGVWGVAGPLGQVVVMRDLNWWTVRGWEWWHGMAVLGRFVGDSVQKIYEDQRRWWKAEIWRRAEVERAERRERMRGWWRFGWDWWWGPSHMCSL